MGLLLMASKRRRKAPPVEIGAPTIERLRHAHGHVERGDMGTFTLRDAPLERLLARGGLSPDQYRAAEKYRVHWYRAGLAGSLQSVDANRVFATDVSNFSGMAKTEAQAFHRQQYRGAVQEVGVIAAAILETIICYEKPLADVGVNIGFKSKPKGIGAAETLMRDALDRLCRHWGIG